ncbi:hypothetical protein GCM10009805_14280 [Leucobacter chromiireducens subsp. solipictus]
MHPVRLIIDRALRDVCALVTDREHGRSESIKVMCETADLGDPVGVADPKRVGDTERAGGCGHAASVAAREGARTGSVRDRAATLAR